jgi:hypothetical protein
MCLGRTSALLAMLLTIVTWSAFAAEWRFEEYGCALGVPDEDGWEELDVTLPGAVASVVLRADEGRGVAMLTIFELPKSGVDMDDFITGFEKDFVKSIRESGPMKDFEKTSGRRFQRDGVPAFELLGTGTDGGVRRSVLNVVIVANGYAYSVWVGVTDADAKTDPKAQRVISGFRFLSPPAKPVSKRTNDTVWGILKDVRRLGIILLAGAVVLGIVRRRRATRRKQLGKQSEDR